MIGQQIGNYQVVRRIGAGGMGEVFEAVHQQIGRHAAIKFLHPHYVRDPEAAARFLNEARAVNLVQHLGLVSIFEYGQLPDGTAYIVMEYLPGLSLARRLKEAGGHLGPQAVRFTRQMASALAAAHAHGVIHRDLKPANVMIIPDPDTVGGERVKILDFGIAKVASITGTATGTRTGDEGMTRSGMMMGTPSYTSPEQCRNAASADHKSDVYSLGVMLYEMLAGRRPFSAETDMDLLIHHVMTPAPSLLQVAPAGTVAPELAALVHAMLAKQPAERPGMTQVMAALDALQASAVLPAAQLSAVLPAAQLSAALSVVQPSAALSVVQPSAALPEVHPIAARERTQSPTKPIRIIAPPAPAPPPQRSQEHVQESTLGRSAGQSQARGSGGSRLLPAAVIGALVALVGLGLAALWATLGDAPVAVEQHPARQRPASRTQQPAKAASAPRRVHWAVVSRPAGTEVIRAADGVFLGLTPWSTDEPAGAGGMDILLHRRGFSEVKVHLSQARDEDQEVVLTRLRSTTGDSRGPARPVTGNKDVPRLN